MNYRLFAPFIFCLCLALLPLDSLRATHIVGGEMTYTCLGNNRYEVALTIFRDCENGNPNAYFDDPAFVGIFNARTGAYLATEQLFFSGQDDTLNLAEVNPCYTLNDDVCIHTTTYRRQVSLGFTPDGYHLVYQRCCRNNVITNIVLPGATGATYDVVISGVALASCNSSPQFRDWPPFFICQGSSINYDNSATDINGDSIAYSLYAPYQGASTANPVPNQPQGPPFLAVNWIAPYGTNNMLGGGAIDPFRIDPVTGQLSGTPPNLGIFVVGICAKEYRNGQLIGEVRRDFQYEVVACTPIQAQFTPSVPICNTSLSVAFSNNSNSQNVSFDWNFGDNSPIVRAATPTHTYPDTGTYIVTMIAAADLFCVDTVEQQVQIQLDGANITAAPAPACEGDTVWLRATNVLSAYNTITNYQWSPNNLILAGQGTDSVYVVATGNINLSVTGTNNNNCTDVAQASIAIEEVEAEFDSVRFDCNSTLAVPFNNNSLSVNNGYLWDFDGFGTSSLVTPTFTFPDTGRYSVTLVAGIGALCQDTFTQDIYIPLDGTLVISGSPTQVCRGDSIYMNVSNALVDYNNIVSYTWTPNGPIISGQGTDSILIVGTNNTTFRVVALNNNGCPDTVILPLQVFQITTEFTAPTIAACNTSLTLPFSNTSIDTNQVFSWDFGGTGTSTQVNPTHVFPDTGQYVVQLIGGIGSPCPDTLTRLIDLQLSGLDLESYDVELVCLEDTATLRVNDLLGNYNNSTFTWSPTTNIISGQGTNEITVLAQGDVTYSVVVVNDNGCQETATASVNTSTLSPPLSIVAVPDSIFLGQSSQLNATSDPNYTYNWDINPTLSSTVVEDPAATPRITTTYYLTIDNQSCINRDSVTVLIRQPICGAPLVFVPSAFSPDNDGNNDILTVDGNNIASMTLQIYNRWGTLVFETNDQSIGWDGTHQGAALPPDVYGYYLQCTCDGGDSALLKGNITLLR
ncbi:MAG: PKD domain-containing protein [Aureispira sp.]